MSAAAPMPARPATSTADAPVLLDVRGVSRVFNIHRGLWAASARLFAVNNLSLHIAAGESLGLVGESGCGKSTLGRMLCGLLPPTSGDIRLDGAPLYSARGAGLRERAGQVQMIFQDPFSSLNPRMRVGETVGEALRAQHVARTERKRRVREMLDLVGLSAAHAQRYPHEFSGGQRQRVAIARALVTRPRLVVCDEPVSALDASVQAQVLNLLREMRERFGPAYLFISHDLAVVGFLCTRIAVMYLGQLVEVAPRDALFDTPAHPYTAALLRAMPQHTPGRRQPASLRGELPSPLAPPPGCPFHPRCPQALKRCASLPPPWRELPPATPGQAARLVRCHLHA